MSRGIDTAAETSLFAPWKSVEKVLPFLDTLFVDIKHGEKIFHKKFTGVDNQLIWDNLKKIDRQDKQPSIHIRIPLIPGINDSDRALANAMAFVSRLESVEKVEILPYHRLGVSTYDYLHRDYPLKALRTPGKEYLSDRMKFLADLNISTPIIMKEGY